MGDILSYIDEFGGFTFVEKPFCEVDGLILSHLSYYVYDNIVSGLEENKPAKHKCGEEMLLCVCNSSRGGGCRYEGSRYYLDQFVSDCEENVHKDSKELFKNNF